MKKKTNKKGFTLIELIVVIAILAVLAMILVPSLTGYIGKSKQSVANANARTCYTAGAAAQANIEAGVAEATFEAEWKSLMGEITGTCAFYTDDTKGTEVNDASKTIGYVTWTGNGKTGEYIPNATK